MKRMMSWIMVALMLISGMSVMAMPAVAAEGALTNLYDPMTAVAGRAIADMGSTNTGELIYMTSAPIEVKTGDVLTFGPLNESQGYQAYFYPKSNTAGGTQIAANSLKKEVAFEGIRCTNADSANKIVKTMAMYSYTATADGYVRCTFPIEYAEFYMITKNQAVTYDSYYNYFDSQKDANLWNLYLDPKVLVGEDGNLGTNENHYATHYIPVKAGDTVTWGPHQDSMWYGAYGYDADKKPVNGALSVGSQEGKPASAGITKVETFTNDNNPVALSDEQKYSIYSYTVPEGVSYVRVLLRKEVPDFFMVQKNNAFNVKGYWKLMGGDMESPYFGANSLWLGDSITQATQDLNVNGVWLGGWVGRVSRVLNMNYVHNGESGWSLSDARSGRIVNRLVDGLKSEPAGGYDVVMLHGGTNDAWESKPVGEMSDSYYPGDFDITTYAGALEELFYYATSLYGDTAEINYILNYQQPKKTSGQVSQMDPHYAKALEICEKWGVNAIDLYHDEAVRTACSLNTMKIYRDWCHATLHGYNVLTPFIVDKMLGATSGKTWVEDQSAAVGGVTADLKSGVAGDAHFTADSKATFAAATANASLADTLAAAKALKQDQANLVSVREMTKYRFANANDLGIYEKKDFTWLNYYNNQRGNHSNLNGYINEDMTIHLMNDIAIGSGITVGTSHIPFRANFDGQDNAITGWNLSSTNAVGTALFPYVKNSTIKNLTMRNAYINGGQHTALMVGYISGNDNLIENCHVVDSTVVKSSGNGMAAIALQPANANATTTDLYTIRNCTVSNTTFNIAHTEGVSGNYGFIVSRATTKDHVIENCYTYNNRMIISGGGQPTAVGGILGEAYSATVRNCGVYGNKYVVAENATGSFGSTTAGVVGQVYNATDTLYLDNCYSDMADYPLYNANGAVVGKNHYSVKAGNVTAEEITGNALAAKLNAATDLRWAASPIDANTTIPMVTDQYFANQIVKLGDATFYTNSENGKIDATPEELAAVAGKIWRRGNETTLTADLMKRVYTESETWAESAFLFGDCMGSGNLDTGDAVAILRTLAGKSVEGYNAEYADVNLDGTVNLLDAVQILRYVLIGKNV